MSKAQEINSRAAEWMIRVDAGLDDQEEAEFLAWRRADPRHHVACRRVEIAWEAADELRELRPVEVVPDVTFIEQLPPASKVVAERPWPLRWALAAMWSLIGVIAVWLALPTAVQRTYASSPTATRPVDLSDGSDATLEPSSLIRTRLTRKARRIDLEQGGARFIVAHEPRRPFDVHLGDVIVSARGTIFNARREPSGHVYLGVEEGSVALIWKGRELAVLTQDEEATVTPARAYIKPSPDRRLDLDGKTLGQAVELFNLYNRQQLRIVDAELENLSVGGGVGATAIEPFALALAPRGIRLERHGDELWLLR